MNENLNEILTRKILNYIPKNGKPVNYLMDVLDIGRESTYRRIRNNIPFTFDEIARLSVKLDFSIDEIVKNNVICNDFSTDFQQMSSEDDLVEYYYTSHLDFYNILNSMTEAKEVEILFSLNRLYSFFVVDFDVLFKFYYFIWLYRCCNGSFNSSFSEIQLPSDIVSIQQKIKSKKSLVKNVTFILDQDIIVKLIRDLQYYYNRKLISAEELNTIKNDIIIFLDYFEEYIQIGRSDAGFTNKLYLSLLNVDMNSIYGTFDGNIISQYLTYANTLAQIRNNDMIAIHKQWFHSLQRSSILISQSNEIAQASFLDQQRKNIKKITNDLFLYYG